MLFLTLIPYGLLTAQESFRVFPYVQHPAPDGMTILWFSGEEIPGILSWKEQGSFAANTVSSNPVLAEALTYPLWEDTTFFNGEAPPAPYRHRIRIENLKPFTQYEYKVIQGNDTFRSVFRTAPGKNVPIRFIAYSDSETEPESTGKCTSWDDPAKDTVRYYLVDQTTGYRNNLEVIRSREPDLIFICGDLAESGGEQRDWDEFWRHNAGQNVEQSLAGKIPVMAAIGNHDYYEGPKMGQYNQPGSERAVNRFLTYFESPANYSPNIEQEGRYYCLKYGPATFIVLDLCNNDTNKSGDDTNYHLLGESDSTGGNAPDFGPGSRQYAWLEARLAEARQKSLFTFVFFHHIPYSSGPHGFPSGESDTSDNQSGQPVRMLTPLFMHYGVDAVICGHDEIWERSVISGVESSPGQGEISHVIHFYDVGIGGDGLRGPSAGWYNPFQQFMVHKDVPEVWENGILKEGGKHYGHLEVDIMPGDSNTWKAVLKPVYVFPLYDTTDSAYTHYERRVYHDEIILTSYYGDFVLPVEYTFFSAAVKDSGILISWETPSEKGNTGFEIQRRIGSGWEGIAFLEGRDTASQTSIYAYLDTGSAAMQPNLTLYYRLKQIDIDGNGHYSDSVRVETISLSRDGYAPFPFAGNFPNPFKAETTIECVLPEPCLVSLKIYNMQGEMIRRLSESQKAGRYFSIIWDGRDGQGNPVNPGIFLYRIETSTGYRVWNRMVLIQ